MLRTLAVFAIALLIAVPAQAQIGQQVLEALQKGDRAAIKQLIDSKPT